MRALSPVDSSGIEYIIFELSTVMSVTMEFEQCTEAPKVDILHF